MKSKVTFDLSWNNEPVIKATIDHSEDVRDKIASRFKEGFEHSSNLAIVTFHGEQIGGGEMLQVLPLSPTSTKTLQQLHLIDTVQLAHFVDILKSELSQREAVEALAVVNS